MQCKDIPDLPILRLLERRRQRYGQFDVTVTTDAEVWASGRWGDCRVSQAMPADVPYKLRQAKMMMLQRRGFVLEFRNGGFNITDKGRAFLVEQELVAAGATLIPASYPAAVALLAEMQR